MVRRIRPRAIYVLKLNTQLYTIYAYKGVYMSTVGQNNLMCGIPSSTIILVDLLNTYQHINMFNLMNNFV